MTEINHRRLLITRLSLSGLLLLSVSHAIGCEGPLSSPAGTILRCREAALTHFATAAGHLSGVQVRPRTLRLFARRSGRCRGSSGFFEDRSFSGPTKSRRFVTGTAWELRWHISVSMTETYVYVASYNAFIQSIFRTYR